MYPGPGAPDYGAFVERMCDALEGHGADVDRVVIRTRASGRLRTPAKYLGLSARAVVAARRADVIWAHYLFPTGLIAAIAGRATRTPWVVTAHGGDELAGDLLNPLSRLGLAITEVVDDHHAMPSRGQRHSCVAADIACSAG
jgi:hypothetical protein